MEGGHFYVLSLQGVCYELLHTRSADRVRSPGLPAPQELPDFPAPQVRRRNRGDGCARARQVPRRSRTSGPTDPRALTDFPAPRGLRERPGFPVLRRHRSQRFYGGNRRYGAHGRGRTEGPHRPHRRDRGYRARRALRGDGSLGANPYDLFVQADAAPGETEVRRHRSKPSSRRWRPLRPTA